MKTVKFTNGDDFPLLGLGTWQAEPGQVYEAVTTAIELGYRHIDCAHIYGNEAEIGEALQSVFKKGVVKREELWITSKLWNSSHRTDDVPPALETTLNNLQLDYLDLYLMHWPVALQHGVNFPESADQLVSLTEVPLADTWRAMETLFDEGKCRHIGVSNFSTRKLQALLEEARYVPEMNQIELHPYLQQWPMLEFCDKHVIHLTGYSPLGSASRNEPGPLQDPVIERIAERLGVTPAQVILAWGVQRGTAVIPKSVNAERLKQNLEAADLELSPDDMKLIESLDRHHRYVAGTGFTLEGCDYTQESLWDGEN